MKEHEGHEGFLGQGDFRALLIKRIPVLVTGRSTAGEEEHEETKDMKTIDGNCTPLR